MMMFATRASGARALLSNAFPVLPLSNVPERTVAEVIVSRRRHSMLAAATAFIAVASTAPASASQTNYTYDALGRLVRVEQTGVAASAYDSRYTFDAAGNRTTHVVSGAANNAPSGVVVVPYVGGYRIIPLKRE